MSGTSTASPSPILPQGGGEMGTLLKSVVDFLGIMYGDDKPTAFHEKQQPNTTHAIPASSGAEPRMSSRARLYKKALGILQPSQATRGPLQRSAERPKSEDGKDYIGQLLDHFVRSSPTQMLLEEGGVAGKGRRANHAQGGDEKKELVRFYSLGNVPKDHMTIFLNQTLDSFLRPGAQLNSVGSMLSGVEMDTNFAKLLSFHTQSNLQNRVDDYDETIESLRPAFIGKQAMFKSVGSVQKNEATAPSLSPAYRAEIPLPSLPLAPRGSAAGTKAAISGFQSMTLDSKAFGQLNRSETFDSSPGMGETENPVLGGNSVDVSAALNELMNQEALSRNILIALEQQLRGLIISASKAKKEAS